MNFQEFFMKFLSTYRWWPFLEGEAAKHPEGTPQTLYSTMGHLMIPCTEGSQCMKILFQKENKYTDAGQTFVLIEATDVVRVIAYQYPEHIYMPDLTNNRMFGNQVGIAVRYGDPLKQALQPAINGYKDYGFFAHWDKKAIESSRGMSSIFHSLIID